MKRKLYAAALLAALGLAGTTVARAGTFDLLLGFNDAGGPSTAQNDLVIDLGAQGLFTVNSTASGTINGFSTAFGDDGNALNNVAVGIVGANPNNDTVPATLFKTTTGSAGAALQGPDFLSAAAVAGAPTLGEYASSANDGWTWYIAQSPTADGASSPQNAFAGIAGNPMTTLSSGMASLTLYESTLAGGRGETPSAWSEIGTFNINANDSTWSFNGVNVVPEPSTYSILAGAGLLFLALRRRVRSKNA